MKIFLFVLLVLSLTTNTWAFFERLTNLFSSNDPCPIKLYNPKDPAFTGIKLYANAETFHPLLQKLSTYAKECHVKIKIRQAFIQENPTLTTTKLNDHTQMAFRLGDAIDFELINNDNTPLCNNICLKKELKELKNLSEVKCFLGKLSSNSDFRQDAMKPNLLLKRPSLHETFVKLQDKRIDVQKKCTSLKMDA